MPSNTLPAGSAARKDIPMYRGLLAYFPAALAGIARWSKLGNDKHNPGEPLHHARGKSMDHEDCIVRHLVDLGDILAAIDRTPTGAADTASPLGIAALDEVDALAWRACALSQELHERLGAPLAPGARLPDVVGHDAITRLLADTDALPPAKAQTHREVWREARRRAAKRRK